MRVLILRVLHFDGCQIEVTALLPEEQTAVLNRNAKATLGGCLALDVCRESPLDFEEVNLNGIIRHN